MKLPELFKASVVHGDIVGDVLIDADYSPLTDEERDLLRLFAALELEDDDAEREEITREIVELMGEMFEEGE